MRAARPFIVLGVALLVVGALVTAGAQPAEIAGAGPGVLNYYQKSSSDAYVLLIAADPINYLVYPEDFHPDLPDLTQLKGSVVSLWVAGGTRVLALKAGDQRYTTRYFDDPPTRVLESRLTGGAIAAIGLLLLILVARSLIVRSPDGDADENKVFQVTRLLAIPIVTVVLLIEWAGRPHAFTPGQFLLLCLFWLSCALLGYPAATFNLALTRLVEGHIALGHIVDGTTIILAVIVPLLGSILVFESLAWLARFGPPY